ncbi:MAG: amidohydrolase family protein, partial [Acidimicrobiia bacterium]|nr:amidohydrolase family protein [Acidimicrobiia bacterium]
DTTAADDTLGPAAGEVVVDVQTHFLDPDTAGFGGGFPQASCGDDAGLCFTIDRWADLVLNSSDTSVAVLSALPIVADDHPMSIAKMEEARRLAQALCGDGRVLLQGEAFPQVGELGDTLDRMAALAAEHQLVAWKTYVHTGGGYSFLDDRGAAFLGQVEALAASGDGPSVVAVHLGLGADPRDLGPAAAAHPDVRFLAYHSGFESGEPEGAFAEDGGGVDRLVRSLRDAGIGPRTNVYCELGSTWKLVLTDPDAAAHVLGKVLLAVGPDRLLWGTDSIWYGSPQDQIDAFRAFEITAEFQERFGYPALTPALKQRVLGGNAADLHGLDLSTVAAPCRFTPEERQGAREEALGRLGPLADTNLGFTTARSSRRAFLLDHPWFR